MPEVKKTNEIKFVKEECAQSAGKSEYIKFLEGKSLTMAQSIKAMCYSCNGMDERSSCEVPTCPLFKYMPYNPARTKYVDRTHLPVAGE